MTRAGYPAATWLRGVPRALRALAALVLALAVLAPGAASARAATIAFGTPTATSTFGTGLAFSVEVTTDSAPERVELELWFPTAVGPFLVPVDSPRAGRSTLRAAWDIDLDGHLFPNTLVRSRWAVHASDGTVARSAFAEVRYVDTRFRWQTLEGEVIRVHWHAGDLSFGRRALAIGEQAVAETADLLGVTEDAPIDFFIYADVDEFRDALGPGLRENVGGQANAELRTLFALIEPDTINDAWVGIVIPHELVHLVFDTAVRNPYRYPPTWLNEGLAVWLSEDYGPADRNLVTAAVRDGSLLPLSALVGSYPRFGDRIPLAYAEGASAVDFLVRTYGQDAMVALVRAYADGVSDDQAFRTALGIDAAAFEDAWLADLGAATPERYGPRPAPAGPLPPDWTGAAPTAGPGASATSRPSDAAASPRASAAPDGATGGIGGALGTVGVVLLAVVGVVLVVGMMVARRNRASG